MSVRILIGDCRDRLRELPSESVNCIVTSPPYWSLRDYGVTPTVWGGDDACGHTWGDEVVVNATNHTDKRRWNHTRNGRDEEQPTEKRVSWLRTQVPQGKFCRRCGAWAGAFGLEPTPELFIAHAVEVFRECRRVLRADGTLWLNIRDCYSGSGRGGNPTEETSGLQGSQDSQRASMIARQRGSTLPAGLHETAREANAIGRAWVAAPAGPKQKDLVGIPWMLAFALRADGWWLRQEIIWSKPNPMPESVTDRCTKAHEHVFLLSKSERYFYNQEAIAEPVSANTHARLSQDVQAQIGSDRAHAGGKTNGNMKAVGRSSWKGSTFDGPRDLAVRPDTGRKRAAAGSGIKNNESMDAALAIMPEKRNRRSVWTINTEGYSEAHFATFPPALVEPCIKAGCPAVGTVLDPFGGAGTTGLVADRLQRDAILIELNPKYAAMAERRIAKEAGLLGDVRIEHAPPVTQVAAE